MALVFWGLGNPGQKYNHTRHNVGFLVVEEIAGKLDIKFKAPFFKRFMIARGKIGSEPVFLVKPVTYMNCSGEVLKDVLRYTNSEIDDMIVILDTLDLPVGQVRLKSKGSSAGHKGLASIIRIAGTEEIKRLYIGIGRPGEYGEVVDYVLERPSKQEKDVLENVIGRVSDQILKLSEDDFQSVMNSINAKQSKPD